METPKTPEMWLHEQIVQKGAVAYKDKSFLNALISDIYAANTKLRTTLRIAVNEGNVAEKLAALLTLESPRQKISVNQIKMHLVNECGLEESRAGEAVYTLGLGVGLPSAILENLKTAPNPKIGNAENTENTPDTSLKGLFSKSLGLLGEKANIVRNSKSAEVLLNLTEQGLKKAHSYVEELAKNTRTPTIETQTNRAMSVDVAIPPSYADENLVSENFSTKLDENSVSENFSDKLSEKIKNSKIKNAPKIKPINENDPIAQHDVAVMYVQGEKVPKNLEVAARYFLRAAKLGDGESQFKIALMYETGSGIAKNINEALKWYRMAEKQGHPTAGDRIRAILGK